MGDELDIVLLSERVGMLLLDMAPKGVTVGQVKCLCDEMICSASKFCGENDIPNNVFNVEHESKGN